MSMTRSSLVVVLLGVSLALAVRGQQNDKSQGARDTQSRFSYDELMKAPKNARAKRNPMEKDPEAVAAGRILYEQRCAECHGDVAEGGKKAPSLRVAAVQGAEPGAIFWVLTNGVVRKGMPVWSKLPEPQRWQLVTYLKSLGARDAKADTPPATPQPPTAN